MPEILADLLADLVGADMRIQRLFDAQDAIDRRKGDFLTLKTRGKRLLRNKKAPPLRNAPLNAQDGIPPGPRRGTMHLTYRAASLGPALTSRSG